ncbi:MAG: hypothetical protein GX300_02900 [Tissierellia bacterium]|nr:hypothetical protein [Tissierellia bacterium]
MKKLFSRIPIKALLIYLAKRILLIVAIALLAAFIFSLVLSTRYDSILKVISYIVLLIGAMSVLGGTRTTYDVKYNWHKSTTGMTNITKEDLSLLRASYVFCTYMGVAGIIVYFISYFISILVK